MSCLRRSNFAGSNGWFTLPHQIRPSVSGSFTTNLSLGERPVCGEVTTAKGPPLATTPSWRRIASS